MKHLALSSFLLFVSFVVQAEMAILQPHEAEASQKIFSRIEVAGESVENCTITSAEIRYRVKGFNPAKWTVLFNDGSISTAVLALENDEISDMMDLSENVGIKSRRIDSITSVKTFNIYHKECKNVDEWYVQY